MMPTRRDMYPHYSTAHERGSTADIGENRSHLLNYRRQLSPRLIPRTDWNDNRHNFGKNDSPGSAQYPYIERIYGSTKDNYMFEMEMNEANIPPEAINKAVEFEPTLNRHAWVMWRTSVTEEIVDSFQEMDKYGDRFLHRQRVAEALCHVPLSSFVAVTPRTHQRMRIIQGAGSPYKSRLPIGCFIHFGIPRVHL